MDEHCNMNMSGPPFPLQLYMQKSISMSTAYPSLPLANCTRDADVHLHELHKFLCWRSSLLDWDVEDFQHISIPIDTYLLAPFILYIYCWGAIEMASAVCLWPMDQI